MYKQTITALAAVFLFSAHAVIEDASAQNTVFQSPTEIIPNFDRPNFLSVLNAMGIPYEIRTKPNGATTVQAKSKDLIFYLESQACTEGSNCKGLLVFAFYQKAGNYSLAEVNNWNKEYYFTKAHVDQNGDALISRYLTNDYGTMVGNIAVEINVFVNLTKRFKNPDSTVSVSVAPLEADSEEEKIANLVSSSAHFSSDTISGLTISDVSMEPSPASDNFDEYIRNVVE